MVNTRPSSPGINGKSIFIILQNCTNNLLESMGLCHKGCEANLIHGCDSVYGRIWPQLVFDNYNFNGNLSISKNNFGSGGRLVIFSSME